VLFGKSRTWPIEAFTTKFRPKYFSIVRAFAGDSTITNLLFAATGDRAEARLAGFRRLVDGFAAVVFRAGMTILTCDPVDRER
jgi:hypothetical protein